MSSPLVLSLIWFLECLACLALAFMVLRTGNLRRWPSLCCYGIVYSIGSVLLFSVSATYSTYYCVFWSREILLGIIHLWMTADLLRSLPFRRFIPRSSAALIIIFSGTIAYIGGWTALHGGGIPSKLTTVLLLNRCGLTAWCGLLIALLLGIGFSGFGFHLQSIRIASGLVVSTVIGMLVGVLYASTLSQTCKLLTNEIAGVLNIGVLLYWILSLSKNDGITDLTPAQDRELDDRLKAFGLHVTTSIHSEKAGSQ